MDPTTSQILGGGAVAVAIIGALAKMKPWPTRAEEKSGDKAPEYWREAFREVVREEIREAFKGRNDEIRSIMREELENWDASR